MTTERAAFTQWYHDAAPGLVGTLAAKVGDDHLAQEAVAEAFARAFERWARVAVMENRDGWVYQVALNLCRRSWSRRRLERRALDRLQAIAVAPVTSPADPADHVEHAVAQLPARMQEVVRMRYWHGLREAEIAERLGIAPGTVAATLHAARRKLGTTLLDPTDDREVTR